ncbi:hypothetical protein A3753_17710 [Sulfitobacter sp. HI0082]|uniref:Uncharacterized protein n=2 Tax=Alphaproteobacteria TaxID=28211 RepID=A0A1G7ZP28_9RHOB|nr:MULTISPECIES: hypothetical protein [Bacteria]KZZ24208.1 hypothetical protein A3753_17710 [Sulfitobacter sp. HI0082]MDO7837583.1 hypothetical protein [Sphingobium sp. HBC34]SDH10438.1 hypothetical protein SAMN04489759_1243 [Sulfitobacter delicatus]
MLAPEREPSFFEPHQPGDALTYREEFPDFDFDVPSVVTGAWDFEDTSWRQDVCPSFVCDVFRLWIDFTDPQKRERPSGPAVRSSSWSART